MVRASRERWELLLLVGILLLAGVLRMGWPGLTEFKADEARLLALALDTASLQRFPLQGIDSSVGFPNSAVSVWIYALPLLVWQHVYAATLFTGFVNVLAVAGCWWLARRYWGPAAGLAAALLFATAPWAIVHTRKIWAQNLLPPLAIAWAVTAVLALVEQRRRYLTLHLPLLAFAAQVHFAGIALAPATLLLALIFWRRLRWREVALGLFLSFLLVAPFLYSLLQEGVDWQAALQQSHAGENHSALAPWRYLYLFSSGVEVHSLAGPQRFQEYLARMPDLTLWHLVFAGLLIAGALWLAWRAWPWRSRRGEADIEAHAGLVILIWLLSTPLFFTPFPAEMTLHYVLPSIPAPYVVTGAFFGRLLQLGAGRPAGARWRPLAWLGLGTGAALQTWAWVVLLMFLVTQYTPDGFGTPLAMTLRAAERAEAVRQETQAAEILLASDAEDPQLAEFAAVYDVLHRDTPHRFVDVTRSALFPQAAAVVLLDRQMTGPAVDLYARAAGATTSIPLRAGEGQLRIMALPGQSAPSPEIAYNAPFLFSNFVKLFGYDLERLEDDIWLWRLYWRPADHPRPEDYHFFNHLLDSSGGRVSQKDAAAFPARQWRAGDVVVSHFRLDLPPDAAPPYVMRIGLYLYPDMENVPLMDVGGNPLGDAVEVEIGD